MNQTIQPAAIRKSLTVAAPPQKAFSVFTEGFDNKDLMEGKTLLDQLS